MESEWDSHAVNFEPLLLKLKIKKKTQAYFLIDPCKLMSVTRVLHTGPA